MKIDAESLRAEAEQRFAERGSAPKLSALDALSLQHELGVHQIELELQNEELHRTQDELEASREKYFDLYDLAPVGYAVLSDKGLILEANLTLTNRLGVTRTALIGRPLSRFVDPACADVYFLHLRRLFETGNPSSCEVGLAKEDGTSFWCQIDAVVHQDDSSGSRFCRVTLTDVTERKLMGEALGKSQAAVHESEDKYRRIVETAQEGIWQIDADFETTYVNPRMAEMLGYTREEMIGKQPFAFMSDEARVEAEKRLDNGRRGISESHDRRYRRKDGSEVWTILTGNPLFAPDGAYAGALAMITDITERRRMEDAFHESATRFQRFFELPLVGTSITSPTKGWLVVNDRLCQILGYSREELDRLTWADLTHPDDLGADEVQFEGVLRGEMNGFSMEKRFIRKDGSSVPTELSVGCVRKTDGSVDYFVALVQDLTERKRAEAEVDRLHRLHTALIEVNQTIVRVETPGELFREVCRTLVERAGFRLVWIGWRDGASPRVLVEASHGDETGYLDGIQVYADERPEGMGVVGSAIREERSVVWNDMRNDPATQPWRERIDLAGFRSAAAFPLRLAGTVRGALTIYSSGVKFFGDREVTLLDQAASDISFAMESMESAERRRQADGEIRRLNMVLEQRVQERTADLEAANEELDAFSHSVSHDLRAPLRAIEGYSGIVVRDHGDHLPPDGQRLLALVRTNAKRMSALIDVLLAFSRTSRTEVRLTRLDPKEIARSAFEEVAGEPGTGAKIDFRLSDLPEVEADASLLRQVWLNLLSNAVKYSSKRDRPVVEVDGTVEGGFAVYRVRDNGVGFDMACAEKLFGVFQRLHEATEFEGTGIGLALVKRIVTRHGGSVWAEGEVGKGATFSFSLPGHASSATGSAG